MPVTMTMPLIFLDPGIPTYPEKNLTIATCVFDMELNHKQSSSALFFSLTRIKVGFLARGLRQKVLESSHGDGFFSRISTRKF